MKVLRVQKPKFPMCAVDSPEDGLASVLRKMSADSEDLLPISKFETELPSPCKYETELQEPVDCLQKVKDERTGVGEHCFGCGDLICDRYLLRVNEHSWHSACLRCSVCQAVLDRHPSCYIRDDLVYCKADYARTFGARCAKCGRGINTTDWVRRARDQVYHLACFACEACKRQLSTGEEFALHQNQVLCKTHYLETVDGGNSSYDESGDGESGGSGANGSSGGSGKSKAKRVRTTFTDEQLQVLQANFQLDSNPDGQDLERIAQITGLSKRVTQVWFQNSRARQKKHMHQMTKVGGNNKVGSNGIPHGVVMQGADFQQVNEMNNRSEQSQSMDTSEDTSNSGMTVIYSFG